jgi:hypothetical protein
MVTGPIFYKNVIYKTSGKIKKKKQKGIHDLA